MAGLPDAVRGSPSKKVLGRPRVTLGNVRGQVGATLVLGPTMDGITALVHRLDMRENRFAAD
eukprot:11597809-Prorocentrum_lima.AAC.1